MGILKASLAGVTWLLLLVLVSGRAWSAEQQFCNPGAISIPGSGSASPYPSTITVTGMDGIMSCVAVEIQGLTHASADDIDVMLVGPTGANVVILSDVGGNTSVSGLNFTLSDAAPTSLPDNGPLASGLFKPTDAEPGDSFPGPAPVSSGASLTSAFIGTNPNGIWKLYVFDDAPGNQGSMAGGWCIDVCECPPTFPVAGNDVVHHNLRVAVDVGDNGSNEEVLTFSGEMRLSRGQPFVNSNGRKEIDFLVTAWTATAFSQVFQQNITYRLADCRQETSTIIAEQSNSDYPATFDFNVIFDVYLGNQLVFSRHHGRPKGYSFPCVPPIASSPTITQFETSQIVVNHPQMGPIRFKPVDCHDQDSQTLELVPSLSAWGGIALFVALLLATTILLWRRFASSQRAA